MFFGEIFLASFNFSRQVISSGRNRAVVTIAVSAVRIIRFIEIQNYSISIDIAGSQIDISTTAVRFDTVGFIFKW